MKNTYKDVDEYFDTFEPLLFEEVKAQIVQQKDEEQGVSFIYPYILIRLIDFISLGFMCALYRKFLFY